MKKNVLVLGGYGLAGCSVVESLLDAGLWVVAAGRNRNKLLELERSLGSTPAPRVRPMRLKTCALDVSDNSGAGIAALKHAMDEADLVINCVGPFILHGSRIARMAIDAGAHYLDIASEQEHLRRIVHLDGPARRAGLSVLPGAGAYPGLSGLLLGRLLERYPESTEATIELAMSSNPTGQGVAQLLSGALEMSFPLNEPEANSQKAIFPGTVENREFPAPFGVLPALRWPQLELQTLAKSYPKVKLRSFIWPGHNPEITKLQVYLMRWLRPDRRNWAYRLLEKKARSMSQKSTGQGLPEGSNATPQNRENQLRGPDPKIEKASTGGIVRVSVKDAKHIHWQSIQFPDTEKATAWLPVYLASKLIWPSTRESSNVSQPDSRRKGGLLLPMGIMNSDEIDHFIARLAASEGVTINCNKITGSMLHT